MCATISYSIIVNPIIFTVSTVVHTQNHVLVRPGTNELPRTYLGGVRRQEGEEKPTTDPLCPNKNASKMRFRRITGGAKGKAGSALGKEAMGGWMLSWGDLNG